jgi:hypothetical protein
MGAAVAVAYSPQRDFEEFRQMFHEDVDRWIDEQIAPLFREGQRPTLRELSHMFQATRSQFLGRGLVDLVQRLHGPEGDPDVADCPRCGKTLPRRRVDTKEVSTLQGKGSLERGYFYCAPCRLGFHPADEALGLAPQFHQFDIQELAVGLAAEMPFETSAEWFTRLTGISVGNHFSHQTLLAVGEEATLELVIPDRETIEKKIAEVAAQTAEKPILVVTGDGANMPLRPKAPRKGKRGEGDYKDAKGFRLFLVGADDRIVQLASWHQVQGKEQLQDALTFVAQRIPVDQVRIALLADGAPYLWDVLPTCFPTGRQILDYYHCAEHIHAVARIQYGESLLARQWAESMKARIWFGKVQGAIHHLRHGVPPRSAKAADEIRKLINYLRTNAHRIDYEANRKEGYPTGSGGMESAHKAICHTRIKRSGAWWVEESCNEMLRIRCSIYNGTFDRVFEHYMATQRPSTLPSADK